MTTRRDLSRSRRADQRAPQHPLLEWRGLTSAEEAPMDLVPYAVPFFLLAIGLEYAWGRARCNDTYRLNDSINSLSCGVLSTSIKLLGLDIGGRVFTQAEQHWALARLDALERIPHPVEREDLRHLMPTPPSGAARR